MYGDFLLAMGTLLPIVNPISAAFIFNQLTKHVQSSRNSVARTAGITCALVLLAALALGSYLLSFFGITIYAFRVAGGLYLGVIAFEMLGRHLRHAPEQYKEVPTHIGIIPVAIPLLSGPGAITSVLVLSEGLAWHVIAAAILAVSLLSWLVLRHASWISRALGRVGTNVVERLLGLLVLVIAVQFLFNGITGYLTATGII